MQIKSASFTDLEQLAICHISAFPHSLSSKLGRRYVMKMLEWYLSTDDTFLFYLEREGEIVGYCGGLVKTGAKRMGSASGMAQHSFMEGINAFLRRPWLFLHPEMRSKYRFIIKNVWFKFKKVIGIKLSSPILATPFEPYAALIVIGVRLDFQGKGYGSKLLGEFEKRIMSLGLNKILLTVRSDNYKAIRAYETNGWQKIETKSNSTTMTKLIH